MRCAVIVLLTLATLGMSRSSWASSPLVVLVPPSTEGQNTNEVINRLRGELSADGFNVMLAEAMRGSDRPALLARAARDTGGDPITIGLFVDASASTVDLWLVDRVTGKMLARKVEKTADSPDEKPEVLARRTVDVLRESLLDLMLIGLRTAGAMAQTGRPTSTAVGENASSRMGVEAGIGVLASFERVEPSIMPLARVRFVANATFELRATGGWLGTRPEVRVATGSAAVDQGVALIECVARLGQSRWVHPLLSIGAGIYYVGVDGRASAPYSGLRTSQVAAAFDAGFGAGFPLARRLELVVEAHALITNPGIAIRFLDVDAAHIGRPSTLGTLTLAGRI